MRKIDELQDAVHHRVPESNERVHEPKKNAIQENLGKYTDEQFEIHWG